MGEESIKKMLSDFYNSIEYKQQKIDQHKNQIKSWPWYGRIQHLLFISWFCPACKEIKKQRKNKIVKGTLND
jgi:hypothetical protein